MKQQSMRNQLWSVFKAPLIYWGINVLVSFASVFIYVFAHGDAILSVGQDMEKAAVYAYKIAQELLQYSLEMSLVAACIMLPVAWTMYKKDQQTLPSAGITNVHFKYYGVLFLFSIVASIVANNLLILSRVASISPGYQATNEIIYSSSFILQIITAGIVIPMVEEFVYRGLVYKRLQAFMKKRQAMVFSAFLFGFMHGNLVQFIYAFLVGMLFCDMLERYNSLKAPVLAHVVINSTVLLASEVGAFSWIFVSPMRLGVVTVVGACISAILYVVMRTIENNKPQSLSEED